MTSPNESASEQTDYTPDFILPRHDAIHEDNWEEYASQGFRPANYTLESAQSHFGVEHVYTGDAFDEEAERPLRHKLGTGIYVDPEGIAIGARRDREHKQWLRDHGFGDNQERDGGPAAS